MACVLKERRHSLTHVYKKTVHNKTTSYLEIRNHVSFKTAFKIKNHNKTRELNVQFVGGQKTCDHVM